jgi:hypothetical protein
MSAFFVEKMGILLGIVLQKSCTGRPSRSSRVALLRRLLLRRKLLRAERAAAVQRMQADSNAALLRLQPRKAVTALTFAIAAAAVVVAAAAAAALVGQQPVFAVAMQGTQTVRALQIITRMESPYVKVQ